MYTQMMAYTCNNWLTNFIGKSVDVSSRNQINLSAVWVYFAPFQTDTQVTVLLCWALFDLKTHILFLLSAILDLIPLCIMHC